MGWERGFIFCRFARLPVSSSPKAPLAHLTRRSRGKRVYGKSLKAGKAGVGSSQETSPDKRETRWVSTWADHTEGEGPRVIPQAAASTLGSTGTLAQLRDRWGSYGIQHRGSPFLICLERLYSLHMVTGIIKEPLNVAVPHNMVLQPWSVLRMDGHTRSSFLGVPLQGVEWGELGSWLRISLSNRETTHLTKGYIQLFLLILQSWTEDLQRPALCSALGKQS